MSKLSSKRRITLPAELCRELGIKPGDNLEFYVANGYLTAIKQTSGAALGILSHVKGDQTISDEQSRHSALK